MYDSTERERCGIGTLDPVQLRIDFQYTFPPPAPQKFHCYRQHHHPYTTAKADTTPAAAAAFVIIHFSCLPKSCSFWICGKKCRNCDLSTLGKNKALFGEGIEQIGPIQFLHDQQQTCWFLIDLAGCWHRWLWVAPRPSTSTSKLEAKCTKFHTISSWWLNQPI